jgi:hypothetical protein
MLIPVIVKNRDTCLHTEAKDVAERLQPRGDQTDLLLEYPEVESVGRQLPLKRLGRKRSPIVTEPLNVPSVLERYLLRYNFINDATRRPYIDHVGVDAA